MWNDRIGWGMIGRVSTDARARATRGGAGLAVCLVWGTLAWGCGGRGAGDSAPAVGPDGPVAAPRSSAVAAAARTGARAPEPGAGSRPEPEPEPGPRPERPDAPGPEQAGDCPERDDVAVGLLLSPARVRAGEPVRILAATLEGDAPLAVRVEPGAGGGDLGFATESWWGVPAATARRGVAPRAGRYRVVVGRGGRGLSCATLRVRPRGANVAEPPPEGGQTWRVRRTWSGAEEALYSAWVRALFHAPPGEELAFGALHELTRDPARNLLHDHLGLAEDADPKGGGLALVPDCADTPYFLRAYFSWKRGLPFAFRHCSRGRGEAPRCGAPRGVPGVDPVTADQAALDRVRRFFKRTLPWGVHTGNGRTALADDRSDLYPVRLDRRSVRPGTVYADPYGHILVVAELFPPHGRRPGILYAVDGQPDGSITRKPFWEGNFLWNEDPALGGSGFKAFRPVRVAAGGAVRALGNDAIAALSGYGDVSMSGADMDESEFYDTMDDLVTPPPRDPAAAFDQAVQALFESARVRVTSVDNGWSYVQAHPRPVSMPDGAAIFETTGAWENYSTPARDLRLLVAIDVVQGFADKVARRPASYGLSPAQVPETQAALAERLAKRLAERTVTYTRSDGSPWRLTLADLAARAEAFEVAYHPNDCPEVRWGAPAGSPERSTCERRAPEADRRKMEAYRGWFRARRRPPRGDPGPPVPGAAAPMGSGR